MCFTKDGGWLELDPCNMSSLSGSYKRAKKKDQATINAINQSAQDKINQNKLASLDQTTENTTTTTDTNNNTKKLITRKLPLNTSSTGATIGSSTSVGLNLGGY